VTILPQLEAHVDGGAYDLDVGLAVLKLYQFHPDELKAASVAKVLIKALMQLPQTDYLACTYLVPERILDDAPVSHVVAAAAHLESCRFREFWGAIGPVREAGLLECAPGFEAAVRSFVLRTFEITYQTVPLAHLSESLGLADDAAAVAALVKARGWSTADGVVKIALNDDNTAKPKRVDAGEAMSREQMSKILASVTVAAQP